MRKHKEEIIRYANSEEGTQVWCKPYGDDMWSLLVYNPDWKEDVTYIVDDVHAVLRKLQIDKPDTVFEVDTKDGCGWEGTYSPTWSFNHEYRVKEEEPKTETYYEVMFTTGEGNYQLFDDLYTQSEIDNAIRLTKTGREFQLEIKN